MAFEKYKKLLNDGGLYSLYVLAIMLGCYLMNQLDRYLLSITSGPLARSVHFGSKACLLHDQNGHYASSDLCKDFKKEMECKAVFPDGTFCEWEYNGAGFQYQLLAGPVFTVVYTFAGIPLGILAYKYNRRNLLAINVFLWSVMTFLTGFSNEYWEVLLARFGLGIFQAGCTPFASSIISDYFGPQVRGTAMGIYNWGIYTGYSMSYALGNFIEEKKSWRWVFYICSIPGAVFAILLMLTVKEPKRGGKDYQSELKTKKKKKFSVKQVLLFFVSKWSLPLLCLAGAFRNAGGYVWALNTELFFENFRHQSKSQIGQYMSWIPLVGGSLGAVLGGFISDRYVKKSGPSARIWILVISNMLAAPFAAGALLLPAPYMYLSLIPSNIIGEMWVGVTLTVVMEMVPADMRTLAVAVYLFIITNIGGNMNLLVSPLEEHMSQQIALLLLYPGMYVLGSLFFLLTLTVVKREAIKEAEDEAEGVNNPLLAQEEDDEEAEGSETDL